MEELREKLAQLRAEIALLGEITAQIEAEQDARSRAAVADLREKLGVLAQVDWKQVLTNASTGLRQLADKVDGALVYAEQPAVKSLLGKLPEVLPEVLADLTGVGESREPTAEQAAKQKELHEAISAKLPVLKEPHYKDLLNDFLSALVPRLEPAETDKLIEVVSAPDGIVAGVSQAVERLASDENREKVAQALAALKAQIIALASDVESGSDSD